MRLIKVRLPQNAAQKVVDLAFSNGIKEVSVNEERLYNSSRTVGTVDVVHVETNTPKAKAFIEALTAANFYDPDKFSFTIRHPETIFASEAPEKETEPIIRPTVDVYEELWQFSKITRSLVLRILFSAMLVAFGMKEGYLPLIIAGLLFLPYHHHLLGMALATSIKEWKFLGQTVLVFLVSTIIIVAGGFFIGLMTQPHIKFMEFSETPVMFSFLISILIGAAAGLGSVDDAGRRELIGLAATAHLAVYPLWFGLKFAFGFDPADKPIHFLLIFVMDFMTISFSAFIVYLLMKMKGKGIRHFASVRRNK